jgi:hypothetical protein
MQIVIYRESDNLVLAVEYGVNEITDRGEDFIVWDGGAFHGVTHSILVLPAEPVIEAGDTLTQETIDTDIPFTPAGQEVSAEIDALRRALRISVAKLIRADELSEAELAEMVNIYPLFSAGVTMTPGYFVRYMGQLYEVIQEHTSQNDWTPDVTPALFNRVMPEGVIPEWVQPTGAHDAYDVGAKVIHNGMVWVNDVAANTWEPGVYGWTLEGS